MRPRDEICAEFPGLLEDWAALDGAAGTQVPGRVVEAVAGALSSALLGLG